MSYTSWDPSPVGGLGTPQRSLITIEGTATTQRGYSPDIVTGLLQTPAYAHALVSSCMSVLVSLTTPKPL
ncbi:Scr1 family TA system antitoxin-like transcriptional regulator [Nocardia rhizosphaerihabitans]|uniref:Scr1 family TA system antitoxin-like transcriptional regulator n=1 Tax=Nocardia rhizosphaerihabitans TaxID=1691570 RepID=UPI003672CF25